MGTAHQRAITAAPAAPLPRAKQELDKTNGVPKRELGNERKVARGATAAATQGLVRLKTQPRQPKPSRQGHDPQVTGGDARLGSLATNGRQGSWKSGFES